MSLLMFGLFVSTVLALMAVMMADKDDWGRV
jgi:hypothetical protein